MLTTPALLFQVKRSAPELIAPAAPTPRELKPLSDIDDQEGLRFQIPFIFFYRSNPSVQGNDPISVVREALRKALVYYYPLAGRLKELGPNRKLEVDCTGELGVLFIAATADIRFEQLGASIRPPFPNLEELLYNVPGSDSVLGCPLLLIQVTRLLCGGFILALRLNHTICDAFGFVQFVKAMSEMARGAKIPSTPPVWQRELLNSRIPPRITCSHQEYQDLTNSTPPSNGPNMANFVERSFFFGPSQIKAIRRHLPPNFPRCSQFELLTACLWKCRTLALEFDPQQDVLVCSLVNARGKSFSALRLPLGYYGNAFAYPAAVAKAGDLSRNSLVFAVELVKKAISEVTVEYFRSVADLMVIKGRPLHKTVGSFIVSDNRHVGYEEVDFVWGPPEFAGLATASPVISFYMRCKSEGEEGVVVPMLLPLSAMERFQQELKKMTT